MDIAVRENRDTSSDNLHIHLYNFEESCYEDSKYVLTSPRSLEACARVGVKPVDLLYKPLADFQEELLPQDIPLRTIYNIYDEHEKERQRKLHLCREERNKLRKTDGTGKGKGQQKGLRSNVPSSQKYLSSKSTKRRGLIRSYSDEEINRSKSSLQRKRTAWTTSVGHTRVTNDEINESLKNKTTKRARSTSGILTPRQKRSSSSLALSGSESCLLNKSTIREAMPIANQRLRKTLSKSMDMKNVCVTPRDQKILELMMAKGEQEKSMNRERFMSELEWDHQKKQEEKARISSEMKRRHILAEENRIKENKRMQKEKRKKQIEKDSLEDKEQNIQDTMKSWDRNYNSVLTMKDLKISDKKLKEDMKKRSQERALKEQKTDEEEMRELVAQRQEDLLNSVAQKKEDRILQQNMKKMMENRDQRKSFEKRWKSIERQHSKARNSMESSLRNKLKNAEKNYESVLLCRDHEIQLSRLEREKRSALAQLTKQKMETEMDKWRESVVDHRKSVEKQAAEVAAKTVARKAVKAHDDHVDHKKSQQRNIKKIHQEVEAWRHETEENLAKKEKRVSYVQQDKDQTISQSRLLASQSQQLRDQLRDKYGAETFDKKAFKAELFNKIGKGYTSSTKNNSKYSHFTEQLMKKAHPHLEFLTEMT